MDDAIFGVMESWPLEWCALDLAEMEKIATQQQKKDTKLRIAQLAERRCQEEEAATQRKVAEATTASQMVETTTALVREPEGSQEMSTEQYIQGEDQTEEHRDPTPTSTQLKRPCIQEESTMRKKPKVSKTKDALEELMSEQTTM